MKRTEESRTISIVETAIEDGFNIRINYSVGAIGAKPSSVNSSGSKQSEDAILSFSIAISTTGSDNIQYSQGMSHTDPVIAAVLTELKTIINKPVS